MLERLHLDPFNLCSVFFSLSVLVNKTAEPGATVILPCRAPSSTNIIVVEWSRPELGTEYVFMFRDRRSVPENQHPSFQNRVDLNDRQMKDGDVSMILKNVTSNDTGKYECRVDEGRTNRWKRANLNTESISIIYLDVHQSGESWCSYFLVVAVTVNYLTSDVVDETL
uniref:Ig-like domain-containing protein n=1 Tax=Seriola dumerili TaxID=41447 RepID=A0A3B4TFX6_SERDU